MRGPAPANLTLNRWVHLSYPDTYSFCVCDCYMCFDVGPHENGGPDPEPYGITLSRLTVHIHAGCASLPLLIAVDSFGHPGLLLVCHCQCHPPCRISLAAPPHRPSTFALPVTLLQHGQFDPKLGRPAIRPRQTICKKECAATSTLVQVRDLQTAGALTALTATAAVCVRIGQHEMQLDL